MASAESISIPASSSSIFDRLGTWYAENKVVAWTIAGVTVVATGGTIYFLSRPVQTIEAEKKPKHHKKKSKKKEEKHEEEVSIQSKSVPPAAGVENEPTVEDFREASAEMIQMLPEDQRKEMANKLKAEGNKAYGSKAYNVAIELYTQAIACKPDPVYYSNRAACWNAMSNWPKVIEDTTAALNLDSEHVKSLNRRANAYEQEGKFSEALLDFTALCIIDQFMTKAFQHAVERLLKKVAEQKAHALMDGKVRRLPSPTFVSNYLQSFRQKGLPEGLGESADLEEDSGKWFVRKGLQLLSKRTAEAYAEADNDFHTAIELGKLDKHEALAYNMRGTFRYLKGENDEALADLNKAIEIDPDFVQSYVKRASMHLEQQKREVADEDFKIALEHDSSDPDIYYHRAQLHFLLSEFSQAATDYQKSIDLDSKFIFSHIQLGVTQYKMGSIASSMATFRRCLKNFGDKSDVYTYYGELLLDQQKYQEAVEKFETAIEMERKGVGERGGGMNVLPLINKALALYQWKQDFAAAEELCQKALIIDPDCDIAVATMAQLLLQQGKVVQALDYFEKAAELSRTEGEIVNALSFAEATRTQLEVQEKYPQLANRPPPPGMMR